MAKFLKANGDFDYSAIIDPYRLTAIGLENFKKVIQKEKDLCLYLHELCVSDVYDRSDIESLKQRYLITSQDQPIILSNGDVVKRSSFENAIIGSNNENFSNETVTTINNDVVPFTDVISAVDESLISSICYDVALNCVNNANNQRENLSGSIYLNALPVSIKSSNYCDLYATYYIQLFDNYELDIDTISISLNNMMLSNMDTQNDTVLIHVNDSDYVGISPVIGWCSNAITTIVADVDEVIRSIRSFWDALLVPWNLTKKFFGWLFPKISEVVETDVFRTINGYQNLLEIPSAQVKISKNDFISMSKIIPIDSFIDLNAPNNSSVGWMIANLLPIGTTIDDFINYLGVIGRIEFPFQGVTYILTYDSQSEVFIIQCFTGFISSTGIDDYLNGNKYLSMCFRYTNNYYQEQYPKVELFDGYDSGSMVGSWIDNIDPSTPISTDIAEGQSSLQQFLSSIDIEVVNIQNLDERTQSQFFLNAYKLSLFYPTLITIARNYKQGHITFYPDATYSMSQKVQYAISDIENSFFGIRVSWFALPSSASAESLLSYISTTYHCMTDFDEMPSITLPLEYGIGWYPRVLQNKIDNSDDIVNADIYKCLNFWHIPDMTQFLFPHNNRSIKFPLSILIYCFTSFILNNRGIMTAPVYLTDSKHFPKSKYTLYTDGENVKKFSNFMVGVGYTLLVLAGTAAIASIVKGISSLAVVTSSKYLQNLNAISQATPGSTEYNNLVRQGRVLRRRLNRLSNATNFIGVNIDGITSVVRNSANDVTEVIKLIKG